MRCDSCGQVPVDIDLRVTEGRRLTMRSCCGIPQWYVGDDRIDLADVINLVPKRKRRQKTAA